TTDVPFQWRSSGTATGTPVAWSVQPFPTAQTSLGPVAPIAEIVLCCFGFGLGTMLHVEPFQCSISARSGRNLPLATPIEYPHAQAFPDPSDTMRVRRSTPAAPGCAGRFGLGTTVHTLPFQCSISVLPPAEPAAQMSFAALAATDCSTAPVGL